MKIDRINRIHELLKSVHNISINDLCDTFQVSKNTIRRDIAELEQQGIIKKVYGGIVLAEPSGSPEPFASRENRNTEAKKQIARMAADFVHDGDVIYIDSGTTTMHMIPYLTDKHRLTIVTASVHVINAASNYSNLNVLATGGSLFTPSKAFVGPQVIQVLRRYNISRFSSRARASRLNTARQTLRRLNARSSAASSRRTASTSCSSMIQNSTSLL